MKIKNVIFKYKGCLIFLIGILFGIAETLYFGRGTSKGFNFFPCNKYEFICDSISIIIQVLGIYLMYEPYMENKKLW